MLFICRLSVRSLLLYDCSLAFRLRVFACVFVRDCSLVLPVVGHLVSAGGYR